MADPAPFAYDSALPIDIADAAQPGASPPNAGAGASVRDITYGDASVEPVEAYLVQPADGQPRAGVLYLHWFDPEAPDGNRTQFLGEAAELAAEGVVSLLPQQAFPWSADPTDAEADTARIAREVIRLRRGIDLLIEAGAPPARIGVVGHDFGAMYGAILAAVDCRPRAHVLIAATPRWGDWFLPFWQIAGDRHDYLRAMAPYDPITHVADAAPAPLLFQFASDDFFIAAMTGRELHRAASEPKELKAYEADHAMRNAEAAADRRAFLTEHLALQREG